MYVLCSLFICEAGYIRNVVCYFMIAINKPKFSCKIHSTSLFHSVSFELSKEDGVYLVFGPRIYFILMGAPFNLFLGSLL